MYRPTYTDNAGRTRTEMGYFTLNKAQARRNPADGKIVVRARDKASAISKFNKEVNGHYEAGNLREVSLGTGKKMTLMMRMRFVEA